MDVQGIPRFCRLGSVPDVAHLRFIQGCLVGVSVVNNINIPSIIRWSDMKVDKLICSPDLEVSSSSELRPEPCLLKNHLMKCHREAL